MPEAGANTRHATESLEGSERWWKDCGTWNRKTQGPIQAQPFISSMTSGSSLDHSEAQFPHM